MWSFQFQLRAIIDKNYQTLLTPPPSRNSGPDITVHSHAITYITVQSPPPPPNNQLYRKYPSCKNWHYRTVPSPCNNCYYRIYPLASCNNWHYRTVPSPCNNWHYRIYRKYPLASCNNWHYRMVPSPSR